MRSALLIVTTTVVSAAVTRRIHHLKDEIRQLQNERPNEYMRGWNAGAEATARIIGHYEGKNFLRFYFNR